MMNEPTIKKVVFVVDRNDLDYQNNAVSTPSRKTAIVDMTENTQSLVRQFNDDTKLIVTTIQKLNNAITKQRLQQMEPHKDKKMVFIFDECHQSVWENSSGDHQLL